ncbi:MAG: FliA/WhiG family RNA polymerase sigma factor [Armatimonadota bacterium]
MSHVTGGAAPDPWPPDEAARQELIRRHVSLVEAVVSRIMMTLPESVDREDLISCGILGLIQAVDRFQPERGVRFDTYATSVIRGAVMDELRAQDWAPRSIREKCRRLERSMADLEARLGRSPSDEEMADELRMPLQAYHQLLSDASGIALTSFEDLLSGSDVSMDENKPAPEGSRVEDPEAALEQKELQRLLAQAIDALPDRERLVIALYYHEELTLREIGAVLGVTESRVCQVHTQAILRLRSRLRSDLGLA